MRETSPAELVEIARKAAQDVDGLGPVLDVAVRSDVDWTDKPVYRFYIKVDRGPVHKNVARPSTMLELRIHDELIDRGDEHYPFVSIVGLADWDRVERA